MFERTGTSPPTSSPLRPVRFDGERRYALALETKRGQRESAFVADARAAIGRAKEEGAALAYGFVDASYAAAAFEALGWTSLGPVPALVRPLRLSAAAERLPFPSTLQALVPKTPLLFPFGRERRTGVREITTKDPRVTRLWDRFSIDVGIAAERAAAWLGTRVFDRPSSGYRVFVFEDGDRYVIRALCIFRLTPDGDALRGDVAELLHDRSVAGMRAASHLLGLALREMHDAGANVAVAWSLTHSGSFPIFARHAFFPRRQASIDRHFGVSVFDPAMKDVVHQRGHWYLSELDEEES